MFNISELSISRGGTNNTIIKDLSLTSINNECISIIGYNGSGKSTLAFSLIGLIPFHYLGRVTGKFNINQTDVFSLTFRERIKFISYVFQDTESQILFGTVSDVLGLNEVETDKETIYDLIDILNLKHLLHKKPNELSSGEAQKLALILAARNNPRLIIYDEATSALDPVVKNDFHRIVDYLLNKKKSIILLGQNENSLIPYSNRVFYLFDKQISTINNISCVANYDKLISLFNVDFAIEKIHLKSIHHSYKNWNYSLNINDLMINQGETIAIIGRNGSGKSTFINALIGFITPHKIVSDVPLKKIRDNAYIAFASPSIQLCETTVKRELLHINSNIYAQINAVQEIFPFIELDKDPFELSFGQQRLLTFLQAFLSNKQIIILDEPELGIDDNNITLIKEVLSYNIKNKNRIILFVTHNLELAENYSSRVIKFRNGNIERDEMNNNGLNLKEWFDL